MSPGLAHALIWVGFVAYLGALAGARRLGPRVVWGTTASLVAGFALAPVLLSHDVYSYIDYARLGVVHGLDPYLRGPAAAPADPAFGGVAWKHTTSAYGPLFTLATYPLAWLPVGAAVAALKAAAAASLLALAALVGRLARTRGVDPLRASAFVALNPLVLVHVVGGAHNDGLAMLLVLSGVAGIVSLREASAGASLVAAVAVKASAAVAAPFALIAAAKHPAATAGSARRFLLGAGAALAALLAVGNLAFGWHWLDAFQLVGQNQEHASHMSIPSIASRLSGLDLGAVRAVAIVLYASLVAYLLAWAWRGGDWVRAAGWASLGLLLATAWLLPWYLIWALPLVALSRDRPLQLLTLALTALELGARMPR